MQFPELELNKKYFLREQKEKDAETFFLYLNRNEVKKWILATPPENIGEAKKEIRNWQHSFATDREIYWAIAEKSSDQLIGSIGFSLLDKKNKIGRISYDLDPQYWRKGIMTMAIKKVIDYAFKIMKINRIEALVIEHNIASLKLLQKIGFTNEGTLRQYRIIEGEYVNSQILSLIKDDLNQLTTN